MWRSDREIASPPQARLTLTFCIQHLRDVQVFLCHLKGIVQVCDRVILGDGSEGRRKNSGRGRMQRQKGPRVAWKRSGEGVGLERVHFRQFSATCVAAGRGDHLDKVNSDAKERLWKSWWTN